MIFAVPVLVVLCISGVVAWVTFTLVAWHPPTRKSLGRWLLSDHHDQP